MAAGLGFKTFTTGEVLTADNVNGYLMQGVLVFASAAARDAAITSPQEGQCCYLKDTDAVLTYSGSAWVGFDDSNAIQNSIVDAKGDIVAASGNDTPARLAVGADGTTLVADSSAATGLAYIPTFFAGKNKIINGAFNVWQRGTSISLTNDTYAYGADRFIAYLSFSAGTSSFSQQTFTPGTAPVAGYEGQYFGRITCGSTSTYLELNQRIEDVRTFAGQTVTFSFWAKSSAAIVITPLFNQQFGSGGSATVSTSASNITLTSSWVRYTSTIALPSISGKTIGTNSYLNASMTYVSGTLNSATIDTWGWQVEAGSTATAFQTATGTIQGELAACQRYYYRQTSINNNYENFGFGMSNGTTTAAVIPVNLPVTMRTAPTSVDYSTLRLSDFGSGNSVTSLTIDGNHNGRWSAIVTAGVASGLTAYRSYALQSNNSTSGYIGFSAEL